MQTFKLSPIIGWNKFMDNSDVVKYIYDELVPLVNSGILKYDNFIVELGNFSSEDGFCSMEFLVTEDDDVEEILVDLTIGINSNQDNNIFKLLTANLRSQFGLVECL